MILETALGSAIVGSFLSAALQVLFDRMASRKFLEFFKEQKLDTKVVQKLKSQLLIVNAVFSDAEEKQISNLYVKEWVDELKHVAYQAEDIVDEINSRALLFKVEVESQVNNSMVDKLKQKFKSKVGDNTNQSSQRSNRDEESDSSALNGSSKTLRSKLEDVTTRLEYLASQINVLGLKQGLGVKPSPRLPTTSLVDESEVCGRDTDKEEMVNFLLASNANEKEIPVIAVVGVGGVGKTTLAQLVYNDSRVKNHFDPRVWAYVSEEFSVFKVTKTILESVTHRDCNITDLNVLQSELEVRLARKRFLLVLDDSWNENYVDWDVLRKPFKAGATGSRILVTSRNRSVASIMGAFHILPLSPLLDGDCWTVFERHAFRSKSATAKSNLTVIGENIVREKIVKKCRGLPLAAKTLGGLLQSEDDAQKWEKILNSHIWDLPTSKSDILPALKLSYYYLPSHLKGCFAYCSIFPKGHPFQKKELIQLWMAEGFLQQPKSDKQMEEVGEQYFHELLSRSLFQPWGSLFKMHDLVSDLAQFVSGEFCFKFEVDQPCGKIPDKARHFSYKRAKDDGPEKFEALDGAKHLRTFLPLTKATNDSYPLNPMVLEKLRKLTCLRALSLSHYQVTKLSAKYFRNMNQIRYLDLSHTGMKGLPESVCSLCNLQTLLLFNCRELAMLAEDMWKLVNLRYLDLTGANTLREMPANFGKLTCLQTLTVFVVSDGGGATISELGGLPHLHGKLSIMKLQNVVRAADAEAANLKEKRYLKELVFQWSSDDRTLSQTQTNVIDQLKPHEHIERITLENFDGRKLPVWLGDASFSHMVFLRLSECSWCSSLPQLGLLPSLQELHVEDCPRLRGRLPDRLPSLTFLHIKNCRDLNFLNNVTEHHYPALQRLNIISSCDLLKSFPFGFFSKLEDLEIDDCRYLGCLAITGQPNENLTSLETVGISDCNNLVSFSGAWSPTPNLSSFSFYNCPRLTSIPEELRTYSASFQVLSIDKCPQLQSNQNGVLPAN